jgi:hypothetical protein
MLHKDYNRKVSVAKKKISARESQEAWHQNEIIGGKPPVVTLTLTRKLVGLAWDDSRYQVTGN